MRSIRTRPEANLAAESRKIFHLLCIGTKLTDSVLRAPRKMKVWQVRE